MSIADLIPWRRKKRKTKVPVRVKRHPERALELEKRRSDDFSRWFGLAPFGAFGGQVGIFGPRMDMVEDDEQFKVTVEVPGMDSDEIDVTLSQDRLLIRGKKREEKERRSRNTYYARRAYSAFRRSVLLPCPVKADESEASLRRGVLTIDLPKVDGSRNRKRIPVRSA